MTVDSAPAVPCQMVDGFATSIRAKATNGNPKPEKLIRSSPLQVRRSTVHLLPIEEQHVQTRLLILGASLQETHSRQDRDVSHQQPSQSSN